MATTPTPAATGAVPTNAGGSNKSTPAPKVGVPEGLKKWLGLGVVAIAIALGVTLIASIAHSPGEQKVSTVSQGASIPLASSPQSEWPRLTMPPGGKSAVVPIPPGKRLSWAGSNFEVTAVYADGSECSSTESCRAGPTVAAYATNEVNAANTVLYAIAVE